MEIDTFSICLCLQALHWVKLQTEIRLWGRWVSICSLLSLRLLNNHCRWSGHTSSLLLVQRFYVYWCLDVFTWLITVMVTVCLRHWNDLMSLQVCQTAGAIDTPDKMNLCWVNKSQRAKCFKTFVCAPESRRLCALQAKNRAMHYLYYIDRYNDHSSKLLSFFNVWRSFNHLLV